MRDGRANGIGSLEKGVDLLFLFVQSSTLGVREIADRLDVPLSTAYRFVRTLRGCGLLEQHPGTRKYQLGLRLLALEEPILRNLDVRRIALPRVQALARHCEETVQLMVRRGHHAVCIEVLESREPLRVAPPLGSSVPLHGGALAKVILAFLPATEIERYLSGGPLRRFTPDTITDPGHLRDELARIRKRGYAVSRQEVYVGARGVAAPILGSNGQVIASLGASGPMHRLTAVKAEDIAPEVVQHARQISVELGYRTEGGSECHVIGSE